MREAAARCTARTKPGRGNAPVSTPTLVAHTGASAKTAAGGESRRRPKRSRRSRNVSPWCRRAPARAATPPPITPALPAEPARTSAEAKAELARTKEALSSREQEATELKSRVKQLEDLNGKDQRLLSLKDSEIADLQSEAEGSAGEGGEANRLRAAACGAEPAKLSATPPVAAATSKPEQKITAKDIWGDITAARQEPPGENTSGGNNSRDGIVATGHAVQRHLRQQRRHLHPPRRRQRRRRRLPRVPRRDMCFDAGRQTPPTSLRASARNCAGAGA